MTNEFHDGMTAEEYITKTMEYEIPFDLTDRIFAENNMHTEKNTERTHIPEDMKLNSDLNDLKIESLRQDLEDYYGVSFINVYRTVPMGTPLNVYEGTDYIVSDFMDGTVWVVTVFQVKRADNNEVIAQGRTPAEQAYLTMHFTKDEEDKLNSYTK